MREDPNAIYDRRRCRVCGVPWESHVYTSICDRHRPTAAPPWVGEALARHELAATASNFPAVADDVEIARREVAGGVPTREWPEPPSIPPREFLEAVMARANGKDGEDGEDGANTERGRR
jgi:hypothetical protein